MRLTIVGCAGSFAGPHSPASAYLVQADDASGRTWNVLLDLGNGALGTLQQFIDPLDVDAVLLSHLHPDHVADICGLYVYTRYHPTLVDSQVTREPVRILGPVETEARLAAMYGLNRGETFAPALDIGEWDSGRTYSFGPIAVEAFEVRHPVPAYAMRVTAPAEDGGSDIVLTYSGDTDTCPGLDEAARDATVFLCEAAFLEGRDDALDGIHLTGYRAGQVAQRANVRHLLVTHIPSWNDRSDAEREVRAAFSGAFELVEAGTQYLW